jgi:radical SAM protein with 4Fe4S-binding SPASM domain
MAEPYFTPVPELVGVEITNRCNLHCRHCFNRSGEGSVQELPLADLLYLFDQVREMGLTRIRVSGGEPTLHPDFPAIMTKAHRRGLRVSVNTHGQYPTGVREQIAEQPIDLFIISLDGLRDANDFIRGRGVFDRVVDTAGWLHDLGRSVTLGVHLSRSNVNDVEGLIALAAELGVDIKFSPLRPIGRAREFLRDEVLTPIDFYGAVQTITDLRADNPGIRISTDFDILRPVGSPSPPPPAKASCPAGRSMLNVSYDGYVYPCAFLVTPRREFAAGHLRETPLLTLWRESPVFLPFRTLEKDVRCQGCFAYGQTCVGGCAAMSYFTTGRLNAHDPTCFIECVSPSDLGVVHHDRG